MEKYNELSKSVAFDQKLTCFTDQNRSKLGLNEMNFEYFQIQKWTLQTVREEKVVNKMGSFV